MNIDPSTMSTVAGLSVTVFSFILMVLLWLLQWDKDKSTLVIERERKQLSLLKRRETVFHQVRIFFAPCLKEGVIKDEGLAVSVWQKSITNGLYLIFPKDFTDRIDTFVSDCLKHRALVKKRDHLAAHPSPNEDYGAVVDEETALYNKLLVDMESLEQRYRDISRVVKE